MFGYQLNSDYTWIMYTEKAFEVGLVTSLSYIAKEEDNMDFKRGDKRMYNVNAERKSTDKECFTGLLIQTLLQPKSNRTGPYRASR